MTTTIRSVFRASIPRKFSFILGVVCVAFSAVNVGVLAKTISRRQVMFERMLYQDLHPGELPDWSKLGGFHAWAKKEEERLEPIVLEILRGEREGVPSSYAVSFVAKVIPTKAICDVIVLDIESRLEKQRTTGAALTDQERGALVGRLSVLAQGNDSRSVAPLNKVAQSLRASRYALVTAPKCLTALRKVGDATSLRALSEMPLRKSNERINRMAALTEKIIEARIEGKAFPSETASEELRVVTSRFLRACEAADLQAYNACFPWGFHKVRDEGDMHEFLDGEHGKPALAAIRAALDANAPFDINRQTLQAKCVCDGSYVLEYIYEVDGWKIMNTRPFPPPQPRDHVPPSSDTKGTDSKRYFIGKPAKESGKP